MTNDQLKDNQSDYWSILANINEWIKFSDQKSVFVITTYSVIITIIYSNSTDIYDAIRESKLLIISSVICSLVSAVSIYFSYRCLSPTIKNRNKSSIYFFGHIANHKNHKEYYEYSKNILNSPSEVEESLAEQIHTNSKIAYKKFMFVAYSIRAQIVSISLLGISLIIYFI